MAVVAVRTKGEVPTVFAEAGGDGHWGWDVALIMTVPALIAINGLFVAAEFALVSVRRTRIEELAAKGVKGAKAVDNALRNLTRTIAATQLGITLTSIALGFVAEPALARRIEPLFSILPDSWRGVATHSVAGALALLIITFFHVVFGELIPKAIAIQAPDRTALWGARPLAAFVRVTRPLILLMHGTASLVLRCLGLTMAGNKGLVHSVEELSLLIEDTQEAGILDAQQAEMVRNVFHLSNKRVRDCMIPRDKMMSLELHTPSDKVLEAVRSGAHTRMPVYDGQPENIVGIVNTKNLFFLFSLQGVVVLEDALYPPLFLKADEPVANALRLFKKARRPMAVVRDASGAILGLVTLEDILEEIVGDIEDEHDMPTPPHIAALRRPSPLRGQKSEVRGQKSEAGRKSEARGQKPE
jgi:CBS domain containing-hemolysin-like protein